MTTKRAAFTLMEMLLVTTLIAVIGVAVFGAFNNGLKLWARGVQLDHKADAAFLLEKLGDDLRTTIPISTIKFKGIGSSVSFSTIVLTSADRNGSRLLEGTVDQIGAVEYYFDFAESRVMRRQANYGQALKGQWQEPRVVATGIKEIVFHYHFLTPKETQIKSEVDGGIPFGVDIEMRLKDDTVDNVIKRFYRIPVGG